MTPEAQRIAIAEACGWTGIVTYHEELPNELYGFVPNAEELDSQGALERKYTVPDYLSDLNAMHEAEKVLTDDQANKYREMLLEMHRPTDYQGRWTVSNAICATAAQRAEAFLRTLGKWDDSK